MAKILSIQHVALTVPSARLEEARRFYSELLGLTERSRPEAELGRPGIWYQVGVLELHIQARDAGPAPDADHHPAFVVDDLAGLRGVIEANGIEIIEAQPLSDRERFFCRDPFGNRLEFLTEPRT
jgi:catechol 2,3-dioxygenase-like lactoylglutathione lyase family enzyme